MSSPSRLLQTLTANIHTIHPAQVLPLIAVGGWLIAPALVIGDADKALPGNEIAATGDATTGNAARGAMPASTSAQAPYEVVGAAAAPAVPTSGGLLSSLFGSNSSSGNAGGGDSGGGGSGGGNSARSKTPGQRQASLAPKASITGTAPAHAPPGLATAKPATAPTKPPVVATPRPAMPANQVHDAAMPKPMPPPGGPPMGIVPRPVMPAPPPPVVVQPAPAPAVMRPPMLTIIPIPTRPFIYGGWPRFMYGGRAPNVRAPAYGGGGGGHHR